MACALVAHYTGLIDSGGLISRVNDACPTLEVQNHSRGINPDKMWRRKLSSWGLELRTVCAVSHVQMMVRHAVGHHKKDGLVVHGIVASCQVLWWRTPSIVSCEIRTERVHRRRGDGGSDVTVS